MKYYNLKVLVGQQPKFVIHNNLIEFKRLFLAKRIFHLRICKKYISYRQNLILDDWSHFVNVKN
jgi:hypothetical protein